MILNSANTADGSARQLDPEERRELGKCERIISAVIKAGANADYKRAKALTTIHDRKLYRPRTFGDYCEAQLKIKRQHGHRLLNFYTMLVMLKMARVKPLPGNERQVRPIVQKLPKEKWQLAWELARDFSPNKQPTSSTVNVVVRRLQSDLGLNPRRRFGEPIDFEGLRHAPINEQGVVFLFGIISRKLGFTVESVQSGFPDCSAKRIVDSKRGLMEQVEIEFEYESRTFLKHGHDCNQCDLLVCWIHNWPECPIPVLELKEEVRKLSARN